MTACYSQYTYRTTIGLPKRKAAPWYKGCMPLSGKPQPLVGMLTGTFPKPDQRTCSTCSAHFCSNAPFILLLSTRDLQCGECGGSLGPLRAVVHSNRQANCSGSGQRIYHTTRRHNFRRCRAETTRPSCCSASRPHIYIQKNPTNRTKAPSLEPYFDAADAVYGLVGAQELRGVLLLLIKCSGGHALQCHEWYDGRRANSELCIDAASVPCLDENRPRDCSLQLQDCFFCRLASND
jgi:hypothetical protein